MGRKIAVSWHKKRCAIFVSNGTQPISFESDSAHFHHAAALGTFKLPRFEQPVTFVNAHLCPFSPHVRLIEAAYLSSYAARQKLQAWFSSTTVSSVNRVFAFIYSQIGEFLDF